MLLLLGLAAAPLLYGFFAAGGQAGLIALAVMALAAAVLAMRYPLVGLAGMAVLTVTNASDNLIESFGAPSLAKLAGPGLAFILAARWMHYRERPFADAQALVLFGVYGAVIWLSALHAQVWTVSTEATIGYAKDVVLVFLTLAFFHKPGALWVYIWTAIVSLAVICALCLWQYVTGDFSNDFYGFARFLYVSNRLAGPINDPNFFAAMLVFFLPLLLHQVLMGQGWAQRLLGAALFGVLLTAMLLTASRGALLALGSALTLFMFILDRRTLLPALAIGAVLAVAAGMFLADNLLERFQGVLTPLDGALQSDRAVEGRLASWSVAAELFFQNPLFGVGAGNFNLHYQDTALNLGLIFRGEGRSAHSLYLEILAELGITGLAIFGLLAASGLVGCLRGMRRLAAAGMERERTRYAAFGIGLFGYLVAMIFLHDSYPRLLYTLIAIGIAMPRIAEREIAGRQTTRRRHRRRRRGRARCSPAEGPAFPFGKSVRSGRTGRVSIPNGDRTER